MTTFIEPDQRKTSLIPMSEMFRSADMNLLHEALSRARMPQPRDEASHQSQARNVVMRARARQARELGDVSQHRAR